MPGSERREQAGEKPTKSKSSKGQLALDCGYCNNPNTVAQPKTSRMCRANSSRWDRAQLAHPVRSRTTSKSLASKRTSVLGSSKATASSVTSVLSHTSCQARPWPWTRRTRKQLRSLRVQRLPETSGMQTPNQQKALKDATLLPTTLPVPSSSLARPLQPESYPLPHAHP
jgi:hypothetical protein